MKRNLLFLCLLVGLLPTALFGQAQATTGVIEGTTTDPSGAAIPGAKVILHHEETGFERMVTTSSDGFYRGLALPLGTYKITVEAANFATTIRENVALAVGQTLAINFQLQVSAVATSVKVTEELPLVETSRVEQSALVDARSVRDLPISGRNFLDFIRLTAHTAFVQGPDGNELSINGQRGIFNNVMIDGADANNPFFGEQRGGQRPKFIVSLEAVKEFQVVAEGASPEFGRSAGGFVNMVTKSGTNELHGSAFFFQRAGFILSRNADNTKDSDFRQEQFGGSIGGPIVKEKAFFFFSYDENREQRFKDKSLFNDSTNGGTPISAGTCSLLPVGTPCGGTVPAGTTIVAFLNRRFGDTVDGSDAGVANRMMQTNDARVFLLKGDWRVTPKNLATVRYSYSNSEQLDGTFDVPSWLTSANGLEKDRGDSIVGQLSTSFTPTLINEFRFQYAREPRPRPYPYENSVSGPGMTNPFGALPDTAVANFTPGDNSMRWGLPFFLPIESATDDRFQVQDNISKVWGKHSFKAGVDFNRTNMTQTFIGFANGRYIFASPEAFLRYAINGPATEAGGVLLYLQRVPLGGRTIAESGTQSIPVFEPAFFVQDKWQIWSNFALTYGLRWEAQLEPDPLSPPGQTPYAQFFGASRTVTVGGETFTFNFPTSTGIIPDETKGWQPRLGFSWDPTKRGKMAIRGSIGYFYARIPSLVLAQPRISNGVINTNLAAGFFNPGPLPIYGTLSTSLTVSPGLGLMNVMDDQHRNPRSLQWTAGFEHEFAPNWSAGVAFNYANSVYLFRYANRNLPLPIGRASDGRLVYGGNIFGPRAFASSSPACCGDIFSDESSARSLYRAFVFTVNKRFGQKFQLQANYTLSWDYSDDDNERDPFVFKYDALDDLKSEYNYSERDQRHRFNLFGVFELPVNFQLSVIMQARSAQPTSFPDLCGSNVGTSNQCFTLEPAPGGGFRSVPTGGDANGDGAFNDRIFENGVRVERDRHRKDNEYFSTDLRITRPFTWRDRYRLEPIVEIFNIFGNRNFLATAPTGGLLFNFDGTIRNGQGDPRQAQLGLRFTF